jgi:hypothetical protein
MQIGFDGKATGFAALRSPGEVEAHQRPRQQSAAGDRASRTAAGAGPLACDPTDTSPEAPGPRSRPSQCRCCGRRCSRAEARGRRAQGATLAELARSYGVGKSTISRLA